MTQYSGPPEKPRTVVVHVVVPDQDADRYDTLFAELKEKYDRQVSVANSSRSIDNHVVVVRYTDSRLRDDQEVAYYTDRYPAPETLRHHIEVALRRRRLA